MRLREKGYQTGHLLVGQPEKVAHITAPFSGWSITQPDGNQCILTLTTQARK